MSDYTKYTKQEMQAYAIAKNIKENQIVIVGTGLPLIGVVPEDAQVMLCANLGLPLTTQGKRGAALACWNIAQRLEGSQVSIMRIR